MSGDQLNQADPLNLDAIEARMAKWQHVLDTGRYDEDLMGDLAGDVPALVAEVRRLRAQVERVEALLRLLVNEGHVSPQGAREIRKTIRGEVSS